MSSTVSASNRIGIIPFTGGAMWIYAFFWPESYAKWLGGIVHIFRGVAGF